MWAKTLPHPQRENPAHTATFRLARVGGNSQTLGNILPFSLCEFLTARNRPTRRVRADAIHTGSDRAQLRSPNATAWGGGPGGGGFSVTQ